MEFGGESMIWVLRLDGTQGEGANLAFLSARMAGRGVGVRAMPAGVLVLPVYSISSGNLP